MRIQFTVLGLGLIMCVDAHAVLAETLTTAPQIINPQIQATVSTQDNIQNEAALWGLSSEQYAQYQWLMQNTPSGHWYKNLDPAEVLALNSDTPDAMLQYAKLEAALMHARVSRELAFDLLYAEAYKSLYPNERPIMPPSTTGTTTQSLQSGDRVWLFIGIHTPLGKFVYQHLIKTVQAVPNTVLDIYFVGDDVSAATIQAWAITAGIPRAIVDTQVTLNIGNNRFNSIKQNGTITLPYVGIVHDRHFVPINLSSVL